MKNKNYWFVGASYDSTDDQTERFINDGIWENGYDDRYHEQVKAMKPGDRIAIKSSYVRKSSLPFDNKGHFVSVMGIKAIGTVTKNFNDGKKIDVDWEERYDKPREWYFYTSRVALWKVTNVDWYTEGLIDFTFNNATQDYQRFCNAPYWKERFGDDDTAATRFPWTGFYEAFADRLLEHKNNRKELIKFVIKTAEKHSLTYIFDKKIHMDDVCPFTIMGMFNRGITTENRIAIATDLALFLGVDAPVPSSFDGIPILNNQKSWFFGFQDDRDSHDIENLWCFLEAALKFASDADGAKEQLADIYDVVSAQYGAGWNITMALYWVRPWSFVTLDSQSQKYITETLGEEIRKTGHKNRCSAQDYLALLDTLSKRFNEEMYTVHSFPELSLAAWKAPSSEEKQEIKGWKANVIAKIKALCKEKYSNEFTSAEFMERFLDVLHDEYPKNTTIEASVYGTLQKIRDDDLLEFVPGERGKYRWLGEVEQEDPVEPEIIQEPEIVYDAYTIDTIIEDGCFLEKAQLEIFLERLESKRNIILQGPPGTGKTWLAKRLGYALMGEKALSRLKSVQFHPNLSYEDFVRGWRPSGEGKLTLVDGPFLEMINEAKRNASSIYVIVIEEINRGNPAQIFGEMLTLLEADKRTPSEGLELSYRRGPNERIYIPSNLFVIGTMNIADRSLALVDLALRRRFAFINLAPTFGEVWIDWVHQKANLPREVLIQIEQNMLTLNEVITSDPNLGEQFKVGHSYVTPAFSNLIDDAGKWYRNVVETEIGPLLDEYWFDNLEKSKELKQKLLQGF